MLLWSLTKIYPTWIPTMLCSFPLDLLRWNTHKFYLRDLEQRGIPIVPTIWLEKGTSADLFALMAQQGGQKVVIKPAVSASAYGTILVSAENVESGQAHLDRFLATHDMLLQPFLATVTSSHERSLIFVDGQPTHAIERMPALDLEPVARDRLIVPREEEWHFAQQILCTLPVLPLYARVDFIHDESGSLRLMELELVEPGLWLSLAPDTVQVFADAIARKVGL
jgi:glutathione synthase/RimK-type ligase-like ATP-grasp enzyme